MKKHWRRSAAGAVALVMTFSMAGYCPLMPVAAKNLTVTQEIAAAPAPTTAEPYTLTIDDVNVVQCREDDGDSVSPLIDALWIQGINGDVDFNDAKYKNIVIPDTMPFDKPVLDDEGNEQRDEEGNVITETVDMPVIKAYLNPGEFGRSNLEKVTVSKNVRVLGDFSGCENLSEIVIPEDSALEAFSTDGFSKTAIQTLYIPANVTELPEHMFYDCKNLTTVTFAEGSKLEKIGAYAFAESGLTAIDIPDAVTEFGEYAFNHCALEEISLPDAMTEIPQYTFAYCTTLKKVSFGSGVITIGDFSFQDTAIEELVIPDSVISIGRGAFNNIDALRSVTIGSGIKQLGGCLNLGDDGVICVPCFQNDVNIETLILSEGLEKIGDEMFKWSGKIETLVIPSTVKHIGRAAFGGFNGISGSEVHALSSLTFADNSQLENIFEYAFSFCSIEHLQLPATEKPFKIWDSAFDSNYELLDADLGNCEELGSATLYTSEDYYKTDTAIGGVFAYCKNLKSVEFGKSLEVINHGCFANCTSLTGTIAFPSTLKMIGHGAYNGCSLIEDVTFNERLETIGNLAFGGCDLHEINLPDTVKEVGDRCFEGNLHVEKVKFSANMTVIPDRFLDCYAQDVAAYSVGKGSHTNVGQHGMLKELIIPDNIKEIGIDAFDCALDLETLDLGKVEYIGTGAFSVHGMLLDELGMEHGSLKTVVMSPCLKEIGTVPPHSVDFEGSAYAGVFDGQGDFDGLVLPATLEKVGANAFNGCQAIKEFTMTDKLTFVGNHAFDGCKNLEAVTFADDAKTKFEEHVFSNTAVKEVVIPSWLDTIPVRMFNGCIDLTSVTLSEGIEEIDSGAFADTSLTSVALPESCLYVRDAVFQNTPVTEIKFGSKLQSIGANVFVKDTHNDLMASVYIPESVKSIGEGAFGYYKDSDKGYAELCKEAEELGVPVQNLMGPTVANKDFILYGSKAAERYANENGMIY
ncbi:MAG: leucine-rich repeat protein, partial [Oscillospiraceae bacterium]|nr:leucine-rich repeat protein [Oscillospiraceae bacterium]